MAALGLAFAGSAAAAELPGGIAGNESPDSTGDSRNYDGGSTGPLSAVDSVTGVAGLTGVADTEGPGGAAGLDSFQMPVSNHTRADGDQRELPVVGLIGLDQVAQDNDLLNTGHNTGFDTPGLTGVEIPLFH